MYLKTGAVEEYNRGYRSARDSAIKMTDAEKDAERERDYGQMDSFDQGWRDFFAGRPNRYINEES